MRDDKLIGVVGSGSTSAYVPVIVYEKAEGKVKEESLVVIDDRGRGHKYLAILRYLRRLEPFLNPWQRTSYVDEPSLVDSGTYPHTTGYAYLVGVVGIDGKLRIPSIPPNPGSKVYILESSDSLRLDLGNGLIIGYHKYSNIEIPINTEALRHHIMVVGATGSGKSRLVVALIREVLSKTSWKVLVFDHSGLDYIPFFRNNVIKASSLVLDPILIADSMVRITYGSSSDRYINEYFTLATLIYMLCGSLDLCSDEDIIKLGRKADKLLSIKGACSSIMSVCRVSNEGIIEKVTEHIDVDSLLKLISISKFKWDKECFKRILTSIANSLGARRGTLVRLSVITDLWLGDSFFDKLSDRYMLPNDVIDRLERDRLVVIDLSSEDIHVRRYVIAVLLKYLWEVIDYSKTPANTLVVIDEAHHYACRNCKPSLDQIIRTAREGRKWGLGLVLATQRAIDIDTDVRNNINTLLFSKLQTPSDYEHISSFMSLAGLKQEYLHLLERREFFLAGLGNPLRIPILIRVVDVR